MHDLSSDDGFDPFFSSQQLAAVEGDLFFSRCTQGARDCGVARCKMDGCRIGTPPFLASAQEDRRARVLVAGPGAIYTFSNVLGQGFQRTALTDGATSQPPVGYDDFFQDVFVDDQHIVYVDNATNLLNHDGGLYRCPAAGCVGTPRTRLLPPPILHLAVAEGIAYVSSGVERSLGSIVSCAVTGCVDAEVTLATAQPYVSSIAADATDVYWTTMGTATPQSNVAAIGKVMRCRLPTCAGGPVVVADNLVNPVSVRIDQTYVYWLTYGYASLSTGQLSRRRR